MSRNFPAATDRSFINWPASRENVSLPGVLSAPTAQCWRHDAKLVGRISRHDRNTQPANESGELEFRGKTAKFSLDGRFLVVGDIECHSVNLQRSQSPGADAAITIS